MTVPVNPNPPSEEYSLRRSAVSVVTEHHEYIYASGTLLREVITTTDAEGNVTAEVLDFTYDASGCPYTLTYTNDTASPVTYYYVVNLQGDVILLASDTGVTVAEYWYDSYGRVLSASGTMSEANPLRYRGYYYDTESEFYYLQSRYYDPVIRRFVNSDGYASTGQGFLGQNMFAYCNNCPVLLSDPTGHKPSLSPFEYDKQGLEILLRWVFGFGIPMKRSGGEWGDYLGSHFGIKNTVDSYIALYAYQLEPGESMSIDKTTHMVIENGESIIGYNYLHGTNEDVGDFTISGIIVRTSSGDIVYYLRCTWNDIIDPNYEYPSDMAKATLAEFIPGATTADYEISISWVYTNIAPGSYCPPAGRAPRDTVVRLN